MAAPTVTYTFSNATTADASQVNQNFTDLINGISDGTKDLSISALTCAGTATFNGNVAIGNATGDDLTVTARLASALVPKTTNLYDLGTADLGFAGIYLGTGDADTARLVSAALAADRTYTLPDAGASANVLLSEGATTVNGVYTFTNGLKVNSGGSTLSTFADWAAFTPTLTAIGGGSIGSVNSDVSSWMRLGSLVSVQYAVSAFTVTGSVSRLDFTLPFTPAIGYRIPIVIRTAGSFAMSHIELAASSATCRIYGGINEASWAANGTSGNQQFYLNFSFKV